jgi:L-ascorbate metabolism protein UlaG (beta-lactamase superfamily)
VTPYGALHPTREQPCAPRRRTTSVGVMQLTHLGHSAVLVQTDGARILIDPGNFSDAWHGLTDLDAVLVTHRHPDHLDPTALPALLAANPRARVVVEPSILAASDAGELPEMPGASSLAPDDQTAVGDVLVTGVGGAHAVIHPDLPRIGNVGFVLRSEGQPTFFHPGDSYAVAPGGVDIVAVPLYGPWGALRETIDFARAVAAPEGFGIHDELLNDRGRGLVTGRVREMTPTSMVDLRGGQTHTF